MKRDFKAIDGMEISLRSRSHVNPVNPVNPVIARVHPRPVSAPYSRSRIAGFTKIRANLPEGLITRRSRCRATHPVIRAIRALL